MICVMMHITHTQIVPIKIQNSKIQNSKTQNLNNHQIALPIICNMIYIEKLDKKYKKKIQKKSNYMQFDI